MSTSPPTNPALNPTDAFHEHFQHARTTLQQQLAALAASPQPGPEREQLAEAVRAGLARLADEVQDQAAAGALPGFVRRRAGEEMTALNEQFAQTRAALAPKPRFAFKAGRRNATAKGAAALPAKEAVEGSNGVEQHKVAQSTASSSAVAVSSRTAQYVPLSTFAASTAAVTQLDGCIVDLSHIKAPQRVLSDSDVGATARRTASELPHLSSLTLRHIKGSLLLCGVVRGPAHATDLHGTVLVVRCAQFRLHNSTGVDVYLSCGSRPVIERCSGIRFAPLSWWEESSRGGDETPETSDHWNEVDDFQWLKGGQSPNWSLLAAVEKADRGFWEEVRTSESKLNGDLDVILQKIGAGRMA